MTPKPILALRETRVNALGQMDPNGNFVIPTPCSVHGGHDCDCQRCGKCGAEITTGMMAAFCAGGRTCEFWTPEFADLMGNVARLFAQSPANIWIESRRLEPPHD